MRRALALLTFLWISSGSLTFAQGSFEQAKPWLGVAIEAGKAGVLVKDVLEGTPAQQYGLKRGDEITAIGDTTVKAPDELIKAVQSSGVGTTVVVKLLRDGKPAEKSVKLVARPDQLELVRKTLVGKPAPAFDLAVVHGKEPGASDKLKGRVAIVEFWATWCPACRATHPRLSELAKKRPELAIVAISDESEDDIKAYAAKVQPAFTLLRDAKGDTPGKWMVSAIPMLVVLDKKGDVAFATIGAGDYLDEAIAAAEKLLK